MKNKERKTAKMLLVIVLLFMWVATMVSTTLYLDEVKKNKNRILLIEILLDREQVCKEAAGFSDETFEDYYWVYNANKIKNGEPIPWLE